MLIDSRFDEIRCHNSTEWVSTWSLFECFMLVSCDAELRLQFSFFCINIGVARLVGTDLFPKVNVKLSRKTNKQTKSLILQIQCVEPNNTSKKNYLNG